MTILDFPGYAKASEDASRGYPSVYLEKKMDSTVSGGQQKFLTITMAVTGLSSKRKSSIGKGYRQTFESPSSQAASMLAARVSAHSTRDCLRRAQNPAEAVIRGLRAAVFPEQQRRPLPWEKIRDP